MCDAIIGVKTQIINICAAIRKYDVKGRELKRTLTPLGKYEKMKKYELVSTSKVKFLDWWAANYTNTKLREGKSYTDFELYQATYTYFFVETINANLLFKLHGVPQRTLNMHTK